MSAKVTLQLGAENLPHPPLKDLRRWINAALSGEKATGEICIRIVDEDEMSNLNWTYRQRRGPTNVLSFEAGIPEGLPVALLGDIVLCSPLVAREAEQQSKNIEAHWAHLIVHGALHLLGYDHQQEAEAKQMENREIVILADLGYANPYQEIEA
jgi:probable rRNA maturation factor